MTRPFSQFFAQADDFAQLESELHAGLDLFWKTAAVIMHDSPIHLAPPSPALFSLESNFFSTLFLYSYYRTGVASDRRVLYVAVNQCLRGMVTGCDNILDDEYKMTLETDLPGRAHRFRSVLDIMVSDRTLFALLTRYCTEHNLPVEKALEASAASLQALARSGAQEASEEAGIEERLTPEDILLTIHHLKTGILFQSPWVIPTILEAAVPPEAPAMREALYDIGIGCQILDDVVDFFVDLRNRRHNYVASHLAHRQPAAVWRRMESLSAEENARDVFYAEFPAIYRSMTSEGLSRLEGGLRRLFFERHHPLVRPAALFIAGRIGVHLEG